MNFQRLHKELNSLRGWRCQMVMLAIAERMWPNYQLFCEATGFAAEKAMGRLLQKLWQQLQDPAEKPDWHTWQDTLARATPDLNTYPNLGAELASYFCRALDLCIDQGQPGSDVRTAQASQCAVDAVMHFLEASEGEALDDDALLQLFESSDLMQCEFAFEQALLNRAKAARQPTPELIQHVREMARNDGVSNLGLAL